MTTPTQNPGYNVNDLAEFINRRMRDISASINSCLIGTVQAINANGTITASVNFQKVIKGVVPIPNSTLMGDQIINYPSLVNVPVFVYQGGGAAILMPIAVGDNCLLLFCDRDMDIWFETANIAAPNSDRVHSINDAIALVGVNNALSLFASNTSGVIQIFDSTGERLSQSGMIVAYGGASAPNGWLLCQGQSVLRATYPNLFAVIGITFGSVDGTHFTLPNMQGQVPVGIGGTLGLTLGQEFGEVTHTLTVPEVPALTYTAQPYYGTDPGSGASGFHPDGGNNTTGSPQTLTTTGGGGTHNNVQPSLGLNFIIKI